MQFLSDCQAGTLPDYSFVEPNYTDHPGPGGGMLIASDQHPDHHVRKASASRLDLQRYPGQPGVAAEHSAPHYGDEHGGTYDHVPPPACTPDGFVAQPASTLTNKPFLFNSLGVRVPAILVSPWIPQGTVVDGRIFEHASIPATATGWLLPNFDLTNQRSPREKVAETFLDLLTLPAMRPNCPAFGL